MFSLMYSAKNLNGVLLPKSSRLVFNCGTDEGKARCDREIESRESDDVGGEDE